MKYRFNRAAILLFLILGDAASVAVSFCVSFYIRFFTGIIPVTKGIPDWTFYRYTLFFSLPVFFLVFFSSGLYKNYFLPALDEFIRILKSVTLGLIIVVLAVVFLRKYEFSRVTFSMIWFSTALAVYVFRQAFKISARYVLRKIYGLERVLVVGKNISVMKSLLKAHSHIEACYLPAGGKESFDEAKRLTAEKNVSQVILLNLDFPQNALMEFYDWCELRGVELKVLPDVVQLCMGEISMDTSFGVPMLRIKPVNLSGFNFYFKRLFDVAVSATFLALAWPFLALMMVLIRIDSPGHVFYHHKRVGYRGKEFDFYKFRSMVTNADALLDELKEQSERKGPVFKMSNDPRVTKFGKLIRRLSIDEIPQIINVLKGDMSIVGPRPQVLWEAAHYDDWAKRRLRVRPGITGLWQVSGRASLSYEEMIELDIYYIENWSLGLDLKIIFKTFFAVLSRYGAY